MVAEEPVTFALTEEVAVIRMDDGKANACGFAMLDALNEALARAQREASAVLLTGRPGILSGGFDLSVIRAGNAAKTDRMVELGVRTLMRLYGHPQPLVIAATGHAVALGAFLLLTADYRVGAEGDFAVGLNETAIGLTLPLFGVELANARLARRHLASATINAQMYTPEAAVEVGFLDAIVPAEKLESAALAQARSLAALDGAAFAANKGAFRNALIERVLAALSSRRE